MLCTCVHVYPLSQEALQYRVLQTCVLQSPVDFLYCVAIFLIPLSFLYFSTLISFCPFNYLWFACFDPVVDWIMSMLLRDGGTNAQIWRLSSLFERCWLLMGDVLFICWLGVTLPSVCLYSYGINTLDILFKILSCFRDHGFRGQVKWLAGQQWPAWPWRWKLYALPTLRNVGNSSPVGTA